MKKFYSLLFLFISLYFLCQKAKQDLAFYENKGQIIDQDGNPNDQVKFLLNSPGLNVQIRKNGFSYDVYEIEKSVGENKPLQGHTNQKLNNKKDVSNTPLKYKYHRIDIDFVGAKNDTEIIAEERSKDYDNYYNLPHQTEGARYVYHYKKIVYKNLYNNIDLVFFKPEDSTKPVEYNFLVHPGGKMSDIKMRFQGAKTKLKDGKLSMNLRFGEMQENIPNSWIENDRKQNIAVHYKDLGKQIFGFESSTNTSDKTIVIDPVPTRIWGSYYYAFTTDRETNLIMTDNEKNVLFSAQTDSNGRIATIGVFMTHIFNGGENSYLVKFDEDGKRIWGTFVGNLLYRTKVWDGKVNANNDIFLVGETFAKDNGQNPITTPGSHMEFGNANTRECFILKLDKTGNRYWGTYYGGKDYEGAKSIELDSNGDLIVAGYTSSKEGITTSNAYIKDFPTNLLYSSIGFIAKFSQSTSALIYGSYFYAPINQLAIDNLQNILIGGQYIDDPKLPKLTTAGTHQEDIEGFENAYVVKFDNDFKKLWGTYYGGPTPGTSNDYAHNLLSGLVCDKNGNIYLGGTTASLTHISTPGSHKENYTATSGTNVFLAKLDSDGKRIWGTYYGSNTNFSEKLKDLATNDRGDLFLTGDTRSSTDISTAGSHQPMTNGSDEGYVTKFNSNGNLVWGTYYGGNYQDYLEHIGYGDNHVFVIGHTTGSLTLGTVGTYQNFAYAGTFLAKFRDCQNNIVVTGTDVCVGKDIELTASGGTSYQWTGPNGFMSTLQNPKIYNATVADSGTYACKITGTGDCDGTFTINVLVGDKLKPIPDSPNLLKITGDCKTVVTNIPTATDNCKGTITATTTDPLFYALPGNYIITWNYNDGNGNIATQTQQVEITAQPLPIANASQIFCKIDNKKISDIVVTATNPKWYDVSGNIISSSTLLIDNTKYYVTQNSSGCESAKKEILVTLSDPNPPTGNALQDFCSASNPTLKNISIIGTDIKWFDQIGTQIPETTPLVDGTTYYASQTINGCESTQKLAIKANVVTNYLSAHDHFPPAFCNDTTANFKTIDLDDYKKELISNPQDYTFEFRNSSNQVVSGNVNLNIGSNIFDVKITSSLGCYQDVKLSLTLNEKPKIDLPKEKEFCDNLGTELDAGFNANYTYSWSTGETSHQIKADKEHTYSVTVTTLNGCTNSASVIVKKAKLATIQNILITNNNATVIMSFAGDYLYSLNQINWQSSNKFENLTNGNYTVYVKTNLGCELGSKSFTIFSLSNIFSPNGDGINDTWKIPGIENYPNSEIRIMDKNGNMVVNTITKGETYEWNGESGGRKLPTDSYWYQIKLTDGRILEGYVVIKNRN